MSFRGEQVYLSLHSHWYLYFILTLLRQSPVRLAVFIGARKDATLLGDAEKLYLVKRPIHEQTDLCIRTLVK
jgi:hypothetical protein